MLGAFSSPKCHQGQAPVLGVSAGAMPRGRAENPLGAAVLRQSWLPGPAASNNSWPLQGSRWEEGGSCIFPGNGSFGPFWACLAGRALLGDGAGSRHLPQG